MGKLDWVLVKLLENRNKNDYRKEVNRRQAIQTKIFSYPRPYPIYEHDKVMVPFPFQKLPLELREEIYKLSLPDGRTIHITQEGVLLSGEVMFRGLGHDSSDLKARAAPTPVPSLLHVSQESRTFALKNYRLLFAENLRRGPIYFDIKRDQLFFQERYGVMAFFNRESLKERPETLHLMSDAEEAVRKIVITTDCLASPTLPMVTRFRNLEMLQLVNIWMSAADRIKPHNEKLMVKNWRANAKKGGWECKIPRLNTYPSFAPNSQLPVRELVG